MKFKDLNGKTHSKNVTGYIFDLNQECRSQGQKKLGKLLFELYPNITIYQEFPCVGTALKLDFYIHTIATAFEFDGEQHEEYNPFFHKNKYNWLVQKKRDNEKQTWCNINNIKLIRIKQNQLAIEELRKLI